VSYALAQAVLVFLEKHFSVLYLCERIHSLLRVEVCTKFTNKISLENEMWCLYLTEFLYLF